ncbi:hypothetical protein VTJ49DRAFT_4991 [Mycothermus thermophilus]|uniref:Uncharacterized protein n=1 Tax=Humicola insolens TaxID=85995 RepID=A0ABR3VQE4_HUMIN
MRSSTSFSGTSLSPRVVSFPTSTRTCCPRRPARLARTCLRSFKFCLELFFSVFLVGKLGSRFRGHGFSGHSVFSASGLYINSMMGMVMVMNENIL